MSQPQTRSHKGYHTVPIYHSKRRNGTIASEAPSNELKTSESKYSQKLCTKKLFRMVGFIMLLFIFLAVTMVIYGNMPSSESSLPPQNITQEVIESTNITINHIISPQFYNNIDASMIHSIPQINTIQSFADSNQILADMSKKYAVIYFLQHTQTEQHDFCTLLLSLSSLRSSTTPHHIEVIVFVHDTFAMDDDKVSLDKLANKMNFTVLKYEGSDDGWLTQILTTLQPLRYHCILYINHNSFVLQDVSVLFHAMADAAYSIGAIWSFDNNMPCLRNNIVLVVLSLEIGTLPPFCNGWTDTSHTGDATDIDPSAVQQIKEMSDQFAIVALPWWYAMDHLQFKTYYSQDSRNGVVVSWLKYAKRFESKAHSEPTPFVIDLRKLNDPNQEIQDDPFWTEWSSKWRHSTQFCEDHY